MTHPNHPAFATGTDNWNQEGLTKREYFAAMAMQGFLAKYGTDYYQQHAKESVLQADALINALNETSS
jgi:hypothetical protein